MINILLCATDAGGVRNLVPLLPEISRLGVTATFFTRASLLSLVPKNLTGFRLLLSEEAGKDTKATFKSIDPSVLICGTTRHASPDRDFLDFANQAGIHSVAIVDDWFNYKYRFSSGQDQELSGLPAAIALPDEQAVREGIAEGLPAQLCYPTGSPSLAAIWDLGRQWLELPPQLPAELREAGHRPVVTFMSETHALDYGSLPGESGAMGAYIGYTETTVRDLILDVLSGFPCDVFFVEKLHPSVKSADMPRNVPRNVEYHQVRDVPTQELCFHSDAVLGMRSMALLEARLLGGKVVSFQPGLIGADQCSAVRLGMIDGLRSPDSLLAWLRSTLMSPGTQPPMSRPLFARADAARRIVQLASGSKSI